MGLDLSTIQLGLRTEKVQHYYVFHTRVCRYERTTHFSILHSVDDIAFMRGEVGAETRELTDDILPERFFRETTPARNETNAVRIGFFACVTY